MIITPTKDEVWMRYAFRLAAEQGNSEAQYNLGRIYRYGHGVAQDYKEAVKWYQLAAEQGNAEAQYNFGRMYRYGQGVEKNFDEACRLNKLASDQGNVIAQYYS